MAAAVFGSALIIVGYALAAHLRGWDRDSPSGPADDGSDDGGGRGPRRTPPSAPSGGGVPLPDARPARFRFRDHQRLADCIPPRTRRPAREPEREPVRAPR